MAIAMRMGQATWEGPLASGAGTVRTGSGAAGGLPVAWAARTGRAGEKTSPGELAAAAHSACYAMALRLGERKAIPERLAITATVTLDAAIAAASELCPASRLFAGARITVDAALEPAP